MKTWIVSYRIGEDKYWTQVEAESQAEAIAKVRDSFSITKAEESVA